MEFARFIGTLAFAAVMLGLYSIVRLFEGKPVEDFSDEMADGDWPFVPGEFR